VRENDGAAAVQASWLADVIPGLQEEPGKAPEREGRVGARPTQAAGVFLEVVT